MNFRLEEKEGFRIVGISERINMKNGNNFSRIPKMWQEASEDGTMEQLCELANGQPSGILGVCAAFSENEFDYLIACSTDKATPENMNEIIIPPATWAVFECTGPLPDSIQNVSKEIFSEWLPNAPYEHAFLPEIEWYSDGDTTAADYKSEVWIPVVEK